MNITEMLEGLTDKLDISVVIFIPGLIVLSVWLLQNSLGRRALDKSFPRRIKMHPFLPVGVLLFWTVISVIMLYISEYFLKTASNQIRVLWSNIIQGFGSLVTILLIFFLVRRTFVRKFKGFGFDLRKLPKDIIFGCLNLFAAWPLVAGMILLTSIIGKYLYGSDFNIEPHQELQILREYPYGPVAVVILINAAVITSVFEEMLFRGLFQTTIRSYVIRPWPSILISSIFFAMAHYNAKHWPALFVLGVCMGYSYEKSGSLFRPITVHGIFNGLMVLNVLLTP